MSIINREQAEALIREQIVDTIFQEAPKQSIVMQLGRRLPNMTSKQTKVPVLDMLPMAYWVNGDTGFKQTSKQAWDGVYLTAAELAVIVPIPEAVLSDASFDILGEVTPRVNEAIGMRADEAIIFGNARPVEWQNDIITLARQAGNNVSGGITYDTLMGEDGLLGKVEQAGYTVTGATYEELGKAMGVDAAAFAETMEKWNGYVEAKNDPDFGRTSFANPLNTAPYYAVKVTAGVHHTMGGLKINANTEVLNEKGEVIPGLFAAGEVTGGVHGANRLGGNAVADFTVFGRIAGAAASDYAA